ncbi:MAG: TetR/AcrR family transcriptional regulator [Clostridiales bacterium]|nr:TetR/AcrR family transcriptional regulator [Clostridiales bacterium]
MGNTKEKILMTALELFARDGYEAVSVRNIAEKLDITKGALYRHFKSKRDIFDSIVARMIEIDAERASACSMPEETYNREAEPYGQTSVESILEFTEEQYRFWTEDEFAVRFRRMLTLEQYRNEEMARLYSQCIVRGPVEYMTYLFHELIKKGELAQGDPAELAVEYCGPFFLLISMYDCGDNPDKGIELLQRQTRAFMERHRAGQ